MAMRVVVIVPVPVMVPMIAVAIMVVRPMGAIVRHGAAPSAALSSTCI
ncbi:MAG: hypothetical protein IPK81_16710 [Rhodospirillales bacterium]|nr:hypothetical protein [Rhodospirillales bacterium]QQS11216.1 MAG: hypothetical protein IPK81_16710 [Rhodospirillales bacterium]